MFAQTPKLNKKRVTWNNSIEFTSACIAATVGLGNFWRFPYVAYTYEGGTFLVVYILVTLIIGTPLYCMEMLLGQFWSKPNVGLYKTLAPGLVGIGWCQALVAIYVSSISGGFTAIFLFYWTKSFLTPPPWQDCKKEWGSNCISFSDNTSNLSLKNFNFSEELYFYHEVLHQNMFREGFGTPSLNLVVCSVFTWVVCLAFLWNGTMIRGHSSYFVTYSPYLFLFILIGRTLRFDGASDGVWYFFVPNWRKIFNLEVEAVKQCVLSLGLGIGIIVSYASYNKFNYHAKTYVCIKFIIFNAEDYIIRKPRISAIIVGIDTVSSVLFGITNFAVIGHLAKHLNVPVDQIPIREASMPFICYPQALTSIKSFRRAFSVIFFSMLFILCIGSLIGFQVVIINHFHYYFPTVKSRYLAIISTASCFAISITFFTPGGVPLYNLINKYAVNTGSFLLIIVILISVNYCYGIQNFCWDIEYMNQKHVLPCRRILWSVLDTIVTFAVAVHVFIETNTASSSLSLPYQVCAWLIFASVVLPIPGMMLYVLLKNGDEDCEKSLRKTFTSDSWRPYDESHFVEWKQLKTEAKARMDEKMDNFALRFCKVLLRRYD